MTQKKSPKSGKSGSSPKSGIAPRLVATTLLTRVIDDARNLDALTDRQHGLKEYLALAPNDQNLARAIAITALRNRNRIDAVFSQLFQRPPPKRARFLIHSLHVAAAQVLFLEVPDRAAIDLAVSAIGDDERTSRFRGMANAVLRRMAREKDALLASVASVGSLPKWLAAKLRTDYGKDNARRIGMALEQRPGLDISVKSEPETWAERLGGEVLVTHGNGGTIRLLSDRPVHELDGFETGDWWVQDVAAALPARLIDVEPGSKVLELCAAPGGKTAQLVSAGYAVTALDISAPRLARLAENLTRLKLEATLVEADILEWEADQLYDAVLLDAPCSSTGTARRHPDVLWTRTATEVSELADLQYRLLVRAKQFLKPGGLLIFSNCSILKEEGEDLLAKAIREDNGLEHVPFEAEDFGGVQVLLNGQKALRSLPFHEIDPQRPQLGGMDGFFAARFKRAE